MTPESSKRVPELDGLRGIAILSVLIWHYYAAVAGPPMSPLTLALRLPLNLAWSGVDLFFVLSGYLIGGILLDHRDAPNYFKVFYVRRICRIVPVYFAWILLFIPAGVLSAKFMSLDVVTALFGDPLPLLAYFTFTQNFVMAVRQNFGPEWLAITWSLAIEEQFYLVLPLVIRMSPRRWLPAVLATFILLPPILRIVTIVHDPTATVFVHVLPIFRADALFLGVLCAVLIRNPGTRHLLADSIPWLYGLLALFVLGFGWLTFHSAFDPRAMAFYGYSWLALMYACLLLIATLEQQGPVKALARLSILGRFGMLAYGIYLTHQAVNALLHGWLLQQVPAIHNPTDILVTLLAFAVTYLLALLSWTYFEKPLVDIGHRLAYTSPEPVVTH